MSLPVIMSWQRNMLRPFSNVGMAVSLKTLGQPDQRTLTTSILVPAVLVEMCKTLCKEAFERTVACGVEFQVLGGNMDTVLLARVVESAGEFVVF
jgi:hypothetical protein